MTGNKDEEFQFYQKLVGMDMKSVFIFVLVLETGSSMKAAKILNCSQSTVSLYLKRAQRCIGQRLFYRDGRELKPTAYAVLVGNEFKRCAENFKAILSLCDCYQDPK
jgi:predicted transcriptional regulator